MHAVLACLLACCGERNDAPDATRDDATVAAPDVDATSPLAVDEDAVAFERDRQLARITLPDGVSAPIADELRANARREVITEALLRAEAERRELAVSELDAHAVLASVRRRFPDRAAYEAFIARYPGGERGLTIDVGRDVLAATLERALPVPAPTEAELRAYYEAHRARFQHDELLDLRVIRIAPPEDVGARAGEVTTALGGGKTFAALARSHSQHELAAVGGFVSRAASGRLPAPVWQATAGLAAGAHAGPVAVGDERWFVEVVRRHPAEARDFAAARAEITAHVVARRHDAAFDALRARLRRDAGITEPAGSPTTGSTLGKSTGEPSGAPSDVRPRVSPYGSTP